MFTFIESVRSHIQDQVYIHLALNNRGQLKLGDVHVLPILSMYTKEYFCSSHLMSNWTEEDWKPQNVITLWLVSRTAPSYAHRSLVS